MQLKTKPKGCINRVGVVKAPDKRRLKYRAIWRENGKQRTKGFATVEEAIAFRNSIEKKLINDYKDYLDREVDNKNSKASKMETLRGKTLLMPKEPVKYVTTTIPADADISNKIDELLGKPTLIDELTDLVIKDEQERYIRELLIRNKELQEQNKSLTKTMKSDHRDMSDRLKNANKCIRRLKAEVKEANENASWWNNRFNAVNRDKTLYRHRLDTANEYIESRKEHMIPEHYNDLKYILNECDLESSW